MASLLIISFVEWAGAFQRPQHLALGMARRGWEVTYASPGYLHRRNRRIDSGLDLPPNLRILEPPALPGGSRSPQISALNQWLMFRHLRHHSGAGWDLIIFNDPRWTSTAARLPARQRIFDCMDDLSASSPSPALAEKLESSALETADRVWTGTSQLADRLSGRHPHIHFIPCGVDAEHFQWGRAIPDAVKKELPPGDGPVAGYFGVLNERVDSELLAGLLDAGDWRIVLIGPSTSHAPALPEDKRLRWIGPRPYAALPQYLAAFDLALIPYNTQGPHRYLYPVKALEYLAGGKPVLTSSLPDIVRFLDPFVIRADTREEWRRAGQQLLEGREAADTRARRGQEFAMSRSWETMLDEMEADLRASDDAAEAPGK